jgi:hypothetical protein
MVMDIVKQVEQKLKLPPLSQALEKIPDAEQLRLTKDILGTVERLMREVNSLPLDKMERLERVMAMVYELYSMPIDRMKEADKILKRVEKIIKSAPKELIEFLSGLTKEQ